MSCVFRQHGAKHSHCSLLHGYAIGVEITWGATELDARNWVVDFGGMKELEKWLKDTFDHTMLVARDDPMRQQLLALAALREFQSAQTAEMSSEHNDPFYSQNYGHPLVRIVEVDSTGCEAFAKLVFDKAEEVLQAMIAKGDTHSVVVNPTAYVESVRVFEHGSNSAIYQREEED